MTKEQLEQALTLQQQGKSMAQIAYKYHVHESTLRRYMRNFERYGASLWSTYPTDVAEDARP
jgi:transposase